MWIVRLALARPYTFVVMAVLIFILGMVSIYRMPTDILPQIDVPVVSEIWQYSGISAEEMAERIVTVNERAMTTTVNDIEHIESSSINGVGVIKVFFQPGAKIEAAVAQVTAIAQTVLKIMPPGATPPFILQYSASSVPIIQQSISSDTLSEAELNDYATQFIRTQLATVQGAMVPLPYGGRTRQIMVDLDLNQLYAKGLSPSDVSAAINAQNLTLPAGLIRLGTREYNVQLNSSPPAVAALNELPIKSVDNSTTIFVKDVANVRDGSAIQTNMVRVDGRHAALLTILKSGSASTLKVINNVRKEMPRIQSTLPPALKLDFLFDQSIFVRAAIRGVLVEGGIAAMLTALMILLFLGSWRSTFIVASSIPLSILTSIVILNVMGYTLNIQTLGGLALAVGILVDDATVELENVHRNMGMNKPLTQAILDGAAQIAMPAFVATLSVCIVFLPVMLLSAAVASLFTPLAFAVVFAMLTSYLLSRTLVPTMVQYLLGPEIPLYTTPKPGEQPPRGDIFWRVHLRFERIFEALRGRYHRALDWALSNRVAVLLAFLILLGVSLPLYPFLGQDFFPAVDAGQFRLHVRTPVGTRLEETARLFSEVEEAIKQTVPDSDREMILDNIGVPNNAINLAYSDIATVSSAEGEILVSLKPGHRPTPGYMAALREQLPKKFPQMTFFFQPADIVGQILNFGLPAPIDIQVSGPLANANQNFDIASQIAARVAQIPGAVDAHVFQIRNGPELRVDVNRTKASQLGLTQQDVASSALISLSSSFQTAPNYWLNRANGVNYTLAVQTPEYALETIDALENTPISAQGLPSPQLLRNLSSVSRSDTPVVVSHYNIQPTYDVNASVQGTDLASVAAAISKVVKEFKPKLPRGSTIHVRGQVQSMNESYSGLLFGLVASVILVYLLMVVNFQSWMDPFIILMALPGMLSGIFWMLFATHTPISVPALMGALMCIGIAVSNSILLVTFANDEHGEGKDPRAAALSAGATRFRPVIMTALAMIIGMLPMSLALSEGGEQNAPLGRAVIGGLLMATFTTLFFVPVAYSYLHRKPPAKKQHPPQPLAPGAKEA